VIDDPRILTFDALSSAMLVWEYDPPLAAAGDLRLVAANRAAEAIGPRWPMRDWIGRSRREMQPSIDGLEDLYLHVARTGETRTVRGLRDDHGTIFDARVFALAPNRLVVSFDDVTDVRHAEETHRAIFERTHDTILIIDPETEVVIATNPAAPAVYGRDVAGLSISELALDHRPGMMAKIVDDGFGDFETTHRRADGALIHLDVHARSVVRDGRSYVAAISRDVVENVPVILWTIDDGGGVRFLPGGLERISGFASGEMDRALWESRVDPADRARISAAYAALFETGAALEAEYRFLRKDGRWAWFLDQSGRIHERHGRRLADGVTQDITDRKRGELQQLALAELGRRALAEADAGVLMADTCRTVASVLEVPMTSVLLHDAAEDAFFVAATWGVEVASGFRVPNHPDRLAAQTFVTDRAIAYDNIATEGRFDTSDMVRLNARAGVCVPISGRQRRFGVLHAHTSEPREFTARETAFLQSMANVLAEALHRSGADAALRQREMQLHEAAEEWRETFDSIQAPILIADHDARAGRMNAAALRLSRFGGYADAVGQPLATLGEEAIWKELDALARAAAGHRDAISMQGVDADGRSWDLLASPSARGQTIIIASDVTELVRVQEKLLRAERMSQMGALVAGVAHEVRNPLFGISATLDAFENEYDRHEFREYFAALREQLDRMGQLMHELLEYGRPFASVLNPECIAVVVNASVTNAATLARQHHVTLQSTVPPSLVAVPMDRPRMAQVFDNLIANAIQHSREGGGVSISAEVTADGRWARIAVEDRGTGFHENDRLRIFEPFFTRRRGGTGLGLSVVHRIVDEHGGTVEASNREGGGASMIVTLPIAGRTS